MCLAHPTHVIYNQNRREQDLPCQYMCMHLSWKCMLRGPVCTAEKSNTRTFLNPQVMAGTRGPVPLFKARASGLLKSAKGQGNWWRTCWEISEEHHTVSWHLLWLKHLGRCSKVNKLGEWTGNAQVWVPDIKGGILRIEGHKMLRVQK